MAEMKFSNWCYIQKTANNSSFWSR